QDHLRLPVPVPDPSSHPHALALVEPLRLPGQVGDEGDQQDGAKGVRIVRRELDDDGVGLEAGTRDVTLDGDDIPLAAPPPPPPATTASPPAQPPPAQPGTRRRIAGLP